MQAVARGLTVEAVRTSEQHIRPSSSLVPASDDCMCCEKQPCIEVSEKRESWRGHEHRQLELSMSCALECWCPVLCSLAVPVTASGHSTASTPVHSFKGSKEREGAAAYELRPTQTLSELLSSRTERESDRAAACSNSSGWQTRLRQYICCDRTVALHRCSL